MQNYFKGKKILVAGGTGVIGVQIVRILCGFSSKVFVVSQHSSKYAKKILPKKVNFFKADLRNVKNCLKYTKGKDIVINLVGIKGSTGIGNSKVSDFFYSMTMFQTNLMHASKINNVEKFAFISSICGYPYSDKKKEEKQFWDGLPKQNDKIPGIVKRLGEIQAEAFFKQDNWKGLRIIRPSNVFGPFDDFNPKTAQVIPSLISKIISNNKQIAVWGDGKAKRDFIYSVDVARAILRIIKSNKLICEPVNLGSGKAISIKSLVNKLIVIS